MTSQPKTLIIKPNETLREPPLSEERPSDEMHTVMDARAISENHTVMDAQAISEMTGPSESGLSERSTGNIERRAPPSSLKREWPPAAGTVLLGKFKVERLLGRGGMGVVIVARHVQLGTPVAFKFLHPSAMENEDLITRFEREARAIAQMRSDHVVHILDVGTLEGGEPYMMMEMLEGGDLAKLLKQRGILPLGEALGYVLQTCAALKQVHGAGIVHRDLKPSNLFLATRHDGPPIVKLIDFGISKMTEGGDFDGELTHTSAVLGSPRYMAPEQLRSARNVDARADIWSLGVILFKLLTGKPPFTGDSAAELAAMVLTQPPPSLLQLRPDLPASVDEIVRKCMEKDPAKRYQSVAELIPALESVASNRGSYLRLPDVAPSSPSGVAAISSPSVAVAARTAFVMTPTRWIIAGSIAALFLAASMVVTWLLLESPSTNDARAPSTLPATTTVTSRTLATTPTEVTPPEPVKPVTAPSAIATPASTPLPAPPPQPPIPTAPTPTPQQTVVKVAPPTTPTPSETPHHAPPPPTTHRTNMPSSRDNSDFGDRK